MLQCESKFIFYMDHQLVRTNQQETLSWIFFIYKYLCFCIHLCSLTPSHKIRCPFSWQNPWLLEVSCLRYCDTGKSDTRVIVILSFSHRCLYNPNNTFSHRVLLLLYEEALNTSRWDCTVCSRTAWHRFDVSASVLSGQYKLLPLNCDFTISPPTHFTEMLHVDSIKKLVT